MARAKVAVSIGCNRLARLRIAPRGGQSLPDGLAPYGGSSYWTMSAEHARYVLDFVHGNPAYLRFFRRAGIPDEIFFQTILLNSPHAGEVVNDERRYVDWERAEIPAIFDSRDLEMLLARPEPFARKFDASRDEEILDALDSAANVRA